MKGSKSAVILSRSVALVMVACALFSTSKSSAAAANSLSPSLNNAIAILESTPSGKREMEAARAAQVPIVEGIVSKTEITATRSHEALKFLVEVQITEGKDPVFQALDLAHELTHALHPKKNPFDPSLNATEYIRNGIEDEGGEAKAISNECQVGKELTETNPSSISRESAQLIRARCQYVWKTAQSPDQWKHSFYYLGHYYQEFVTRWLAATSPETTGAVRSNEVAKAAFKIESRSPVFSSAVAHKPYPLALLEEYLEITRVICDRAKLTFSAANPGLDRVPTSISSTGEAAAKTVFGTSLETRCRGLESVRN